MGTKNTKKGPRAWRIAAGYSQQEFAHVLRITKAHLSRLETGERKPSADLAERFRVATHGAIRLQDFPAMSRKGRAA